MTDVADAPKAARTDRRDKSIAAAPNFDLLDIYANGTLIAKGEIVSVDGRYGIQVAEVVAPARGLEGLDRRA